MSRILGIIPARTGSQRIRNKNFKFFGNKPLVLHTLEQAIACKSLDRIIVSTNHVELENIIPEKLLPYFIKRPEELCKPTSRGFSYAKHALEYCDNHYDDQFTHFVALPPTAPLRLPSDIDSCVEILLKEQCDTVTSMVKTNMMFHAFKQKKITHDGKVVPFLIEEEGKTAYQELPEVYVRNCAVYASKVEVLGLRTMIGEDCRGYIMPAERSVDINENIDFEFARFLFEHGKNRSE